MKLGRNSKTFYVFDTETGIIDKKGNIEYIFSARPQHLIFGVVYGANGFKRVIHSADEFKKEFKKKRYKSKIVYAHNAEYDLSAVYGNIYELDPGAIFNGKFISCSNGNCRFADSYNLLPTSVKKLGELLGLSKKELGQNLISSLKNLPQDIDYCKRDCEIVYKSLEKFFTGLEPCFTVGSLSLKTFRLKFLTKTIKVSEHSDKFFDALYGGRTEAFYIGKCKANVYDINSAYPRAMLNDLPNPTKLRVVYNPDSEMVRQVLRDYEGMISCKVHVNENEKLPVLPYKMDERLIFPTGIFTGSWTFPEFRYAMRVNKIKILEVSEIVFAPAIKSPFIPFIKFYWNERTKTLDAFLKYLFKLIMNNLYGKLIQRAREEYRYFKEENRKEIREFMRKMKIRQCEIIEVNQGIFLRYKTNRIFSHTIACFGAYITAYVRVMLHKMMYKHLDKLKYCDTDSVFIQRKLNLNSTELGGWKLENKLITRVRALKDYVYIEDEKEKQMLKGVKKDAIQLDPEANVFRFNRMIKTRESFRRVDNLPPGTFIDQIKVITGDYLKRIVNKDGTTRPFIIREKQNKLK